MVRTFIALTAILLSQPAVAELGASVSVRIPRAADRPQIVDTLPVDGSTIETAMPAVQFVFSMNMDTTRTNASKVFLPSGMTVTGLVWTDARTLSIRYSGNLDSYGAKRVDLADSYFCNTEGIAIPLFGGLAFAYLETNSPPSPPTITFKTTDVAAGQQVQFNATASDPNGDQVTITWDFGDGSSGTGTSVTHTYTGTGPYLASATANDGRGGTTTKSILLGGGATPPTAGTTWMVTKAQIGLNFKTAGKDKIAIAGVTELPAGYDPSGKTLSVNVGGAAQVFTLNGKGIGKAGKDQFKMTRKLTNKQFLGGAVKIQVTMNGAFVNQLADDGLTNATTPKTGSLAIVQMMLGLEGKVYIGQPTILWIATAGKSGKGKWQTAVQ